MAYQTYTTDALVIGAHDRLTADRTIALFTRDAGLVHARAISVRREKSKLRYGLQDFSLVRVSLVRGKAGWRVIGAERTRNFYFSTESRQTRAAILRIVKMLRRLVQGEETNVMLYDVLTDGLAVLSATQEEGIMHAERVLMLRLLCALGYVAPKAEYRELLSAPSLASALAVRPGDAPAETVRRAIDQALTISQL